MYASSGIKPLGLGLIGLGGAAVNMLPRFKRSPYFDVVGVADKDGEILSRFKADHPDAQTYREVAALCDDPRVTLVHIGTPNHLHFEHARTALERGKHVLIEKPMAVTLDDAQEMIAIAKRNGVLLGVNVKHSFEPRVRKLRELAVSGELGALRSIHSWRYVDWLYRPRSAEELTPGWGSGILWRQGPHQFDIIRTIGGGMVRSVRASTGIWDPSRRVAGAFTVFFEFEDGVCGTAVCSGYDHFDSRDYVFGFDPAGPPNDAGRYAKARRELLSHASEPGWEDAAAGAERYGGGRRSTAASKRKGRSGGWILGGPIVASFEKADVRLTPAGLAIDGDERQWEVALDGDGRDFRLQSFYAAIAKGAPLAADGQWGLATQEMLAAIEQSAASRSEIKLVHQTPVVDTPVVRAG